MFGGHATAGGCAPHAIGGISDEDVSLECLNCSGVEGAIFHNLRLKVLADLSLLRMIVLGSTHTSGIVSSTSRF